MRDDGDHAEAIAAGGEGDRLPVITAGRADHALRLRLRAAEVIEVHETTAHLEGAERGVILVFRPELDAGALLEERPAELWRGSHAA